MGHRRTRLSPTCNVAEFSRSRPNYERRQKGKKVKEADLYSAFIEVPYTQGAQVRITQCYLQITPYLPLPPFRQAPQNAALGMWASLTHRNTTLPHVLLCRIVSKPNRANVAYLQQGLKNPFCNLQEALGKMNDELCGCLGQIFVE